jgi:hypothetical protein
MTRQRDAGEVIAAAMRRGEWERVALALLLGVAIAARAMSDANIDDLLAFLAEDDGAARDVQGATSRARRSARRNGDA